MGLESSHPSADRGREKQLYVPLGVLRGIDDVASGNTASKEEIQAALKF